MPYCLVLKACKALMKYEAALETQPFKGSGFEQWTLHTRRQGIIEQCLKPSPDHFCNFPTLTVQYSRPLNHCWTGVLFLDNDLYHVLIKIYQKCKKTDSSSSIFKQLSRLPPSVTARFSPCLQVKPANTLVFHVLGTTQIISSILPP